jgi:predicted TIM-barrel fold metal-dependent hydrolase
MSKASSGMKACAPPDPNPAKPARLVLPPGTIDTHAHIFGPATRYPWNPKRGYTPPDALPDAYEALHAALGVARGVLTQPSVYGTDNSCMLDYAARHPKRMRAVVAVDPAITDAALEAMHAQGARGIRVNIADPGGNPFSSFSEIEAFAHRLKLLGWHIEFLLHVNDLGDWAQAIRRLPVDISIGHLGYMPTSLGVTHPAFQSFLGMLDDGRCWVKLTAPYRITGLKAVPYADVTPFAQALVTRRPDRIVWGTDWPHPICPISMPNDGHLTDHLADWVPDAATRQMVLVANPERLYDF